MQGHENVIHGVFYYAKHLFENDRYVDASFVEKGNNNKVKRPCLTFCLLQLVSLNVLMCMEYRYHIYYRLLYFFEKSIHYL